MSSAPWHFIMPIVITKPHPLPRPLHHPQCRSQAANQIAKMLYSYMPKPRRHTNYGNLGWKRSHGQKDKSTVAFVKWRGPCCMCVCVCWMKTLCLFTLVWERERQRERFDLKKLVRPTWWEVCRFFTCHRAKWCESRRDYAFRCSLSHTDYIASNVGRPEVSTFALKRKKTKRVNNCLNF